jgi:signal transduction histidine kinase
VERAGGHGSHILEISPQATEFPVDCKFLIATISDMLLRILALLLITLTPIAASARDNPYRVLLLHSLGGGQPVNAEFSDGIFRGLNPEADLRIEFESEYLDLSRVNDEAYIQKLIEVYQLKFPPGQLDLIIATYTPAFRFLLKHGQEAFPDVPIVFCGAEIKFDDGLQLPPNVTGVTIRRDFAGTLELISWLHPDMKRVALIVGSSKMDKQWEQDAKQAFLPYEKKFDFIWLKGLPLRELTETVKTLPRSTGVLYLVQFGDREGTPQIPSLTAQALSDAANAPVFGLWDTLIGKGIVGGRMIAVRDSGVVAGKIGRRILMGEAPAAIPVVSMERNDAIFNARQLKRWNIDESRLPVGSRVLNREPSVWEDHKEAITLGAAVITLLCLGILALLWNRTKLQQAQISLKDEFAQRMKAERMSRRLRNRMNAAEKHSSLGVLAAGIAHEVNQPLISIQNYAQAARRYIPSDAVHEPKLNELLTEIEHEAGRAGTIIQKTRKLLASGRVEAVLTAVDSILKEVLAALRPEIESHNCRIDYDPGTSVPAVLADPLQIQLVLGNLLHNALQAMESTDQHGSKLISITVCTITGQQVQISVADRGSGVPADVDEEVFDPLFTTKPKGMGVGLSACRTIIEAHGGRIWHTPNPLGGAIFHFTLPIAGAIDLRS